MKKIEMIKKQGDFQKIIDNKQYIKNKYYVIYSINNEDNFPHFGIAIGKKYGNAVDRNKIKRITRNIIDENKLLFKKSNNYIIMIRKTCKDASYQQLNQSVKSLLEEK